MDNVDVEKLRPLLEAKLQPWRLRATMMFAGLYQLVHEEIRRVVIDSVRGFYVIGLDATREEAIYKSSVLDLDKGSKLRASLRWLIFMDAITAEQADRLSTIFGHRHDLAHELMKYLVDPAFEPDVDLLLDGLAILRTIHNFWIQVEIDIGAFDNHPGIGPEDVTPSTLLLLSMCIDAYADGMRRETPETAFWASDHHDPESDNRVSGEEGRPDGEESPDLAQAPEDQSRVDELTRYVEALEADHGPIPAEVAAQVLADIATADAGARPQATGLMTPMVMTNATADAAGPGRH